MTAKEIQKRNAKAESLRVLQADDGSFYVESEKGKILYNVILDDEETSCTCGDFAKNSKKDSNFQCKHMLAVLNAIPKQEIENARYCEKHVPKLDDRFMTNIKGKDFVLYAGVLDLATQKGLLKLEVELLQYPTKENGNEAICRAVAESKTGEVFADIGDANPNNCHSMIAKHLIRMASTRAKGRALRDMCNISIVCLEELADFDDVIGSGTAKRASRKKAAGQPDKKETKPKADPKKKTQAKGEPEPDNKASGTKPKDSKKPESKSEANDGNNSGQPSMSEAQKRAIYNLSRRRGISVEDLEQRAIDAYNVSVESMSSKEASVFIRSLQQAA
ncbi:SWIM zinc finger family protein [Thermodesulfobacteriota bacterium]